MRAQYFNTPVHKRLFKSYSVKNSEEGEVILEYIGKSSINKSNLMTAFSRLGTFKFRQGWLGGKHAYKGKSVRVLSLAATELHKIHEAHKSKNILSI